MAACRWLFPQIEYGRNLPRDGTSKGNCRDEQGPISGSRLMAVLAVCAGAAIC